jgi:hypothetical protein
MWQHIEPADIERAKESLGHRLSQTLSRHADEIKALQAKQTEEISALENKQTELASLEALIERFAGEFQNREPATSEPRVDHDGISGELGSDNTGLDEESAPIEASASTEPLPNGAEPLNIAYASPNFRSFRKLAS